MANLVIVGTQWGCQGKNKIVDSLVHGTYGCCVREIRAIESDIHGPRERLREYDLCLI